jgi:hypothetical protein
VQRVGEAWLSLWMSPWLDGGGARAGCRPDRGGAVARHLPNGAVQRARCSGRSSRASHGPSQTGHGRGGGSRSPMGVAAGRWRSSVGAGAGRRARRLVEELSGHHDE